MNHFWDQYLIAEEKCLKSQWKILLDEFIKAYFRASEEERLTWLAQNLHLIVDHKVPLRYPVFEKIIFPFLFKGYHKQDFACVKHLIQLYDHVCLLDIYRQGKFAPTLSSLLDFGLSLRSNDIELLMIAYKTKKSELEYSVHDLPRGVLYGSNGANAIQCLDLLEDLNRFEEICKRLGKEEAAFINMCRWHYQHYPSYISSLKQKQFQSYKEYIQFHGK